MANGGARENTHTTQLASPTSATCLGTQTKHPGRRAGVGLAFTPCSAGLTAKKMPFQFSTAPRLKLHGNRFHNSLEKLKKSRPFSTQNTFILLIKLFPHVKTTHKAEVERKFRKIAEKIPNLTQVPSPTLLFQQFLTRFNQLKKKTVGQTSDCNSGRVVPQHSLNEHTKENAMHLIHHVMHPSFFWLLPLKNVQLQK